MKEIKIGNKKYKLQYGYAVIARGKVLSHAMKLQEMFNGEGKEDVDFFSQMSEIMDSLGEMLLAALQKNHRDEFGYNVRTGNGHDEAIEKVFDLLDRYFDTDDADTMELFGTLFDELESNGFLRHLAQEIKENTEPENQTE